MADLVQDTPAGWSVATVRDGAEDLLHLVATCRCGVAGEFVVDPSQCGTGQHATDVTCGMCSEVAQVVWRTEPTEAGP